MKRFHKHKLWVLTILLTAPVMVLAAVPNVFTAGTVISSAQVNANFAGLDLRLATLEAAALKKTTATVVMNNVPGPLPKSVAFSSSGGPLLIIVTASGFSSTINTMLGVTAQLDGRNIGEMNRYTNEAFSHKLMPTGMFRVDVAAGNHTLLLVPSLTALTDVRDFFSATVMELH